MSSASRGLAPREGLEWLSMKMGRTRPLAEPRPGPQAGKSGDPRFQNAGNGRVLALAGCSTSDNVFRIKEIDGSYQWLQDAIYMV